MRGHQVTLILMISTLLTASVLLTLPCADMPLRAGTSWTYRAQVPSTRAGAGATRATTIIWTTKILATLERDSSIVATVVNWPSNLAWWDPSQPPDTTLLVCLNNRVHHLGRDQRGGASATAEAAAGSLSLTAANLVLELPLHRGQLYGQEPSDRADTFYGWYVEAAAPMPKTLARLGAHPTDSLYTIAYRTVPDHQILEFAPGLGVTRYTYVHHGTMATTSATLISARLAP
jgi:hypothetical protein